MQPIERLTPDQPIPALEGFTVGDFWAWAYSDLLSNRNRAIFAEFLVGSALGVLDKPRIEWDSYDLLYKEKKIEVKASAYLQSWYQSQLSNIKFDIRCKKAWDPLTNKMAVEPRRSADCYVFCLFTETNPTKSNILDINAWRFYVVSAQQIDRICGQQKSISLGRLKQLTEAIDYDTLHKAIDRLS